MFNNRNILIIDERDKVELVLYKRVCTYRKKRFSRVLGMEPFVLSEVKREPIKPH